MEIFDIDLWLAEEPVLGCHILSLLKCCMVCMAKLLLRFATDGKRLNSWKTSCFRWFRTTWTYFLSAWYFLFSSCLSLRALLPLQIRFLFLNFYSLTAPYIVTGRESWVIYLCAIFGRFPFSRDCIEMIGHHQSIFLNMFFNFVYFCFEIANDM